MDEEPIERNQPILNGMWTLREKGRIRALYAQRNVRNSPKRSKNTFSPRIKGNDIVIEELGMSDDEIRAVKKIMIVACGSAYHAGVTGKYVLEGMARIPVEVDLASEFRYRDPILVRRDTGHCDQVSPERLRIPSLHFASLMQGGQRYSAL